MKRAVSSIRSRDVAHLAAAATAPRQRRRRRGTRQFRLHKPRGSTCSPTRASSTPSSAAPPAPGDAVLEVGGHRNLTVRLLESPAARVSAVEIDPRMVDAVTARVDALGLAHKLTVRLAVPTIRSIKCLQES